MLTQTTPLSSADFARVVRSHDFSAMEAIVVGYGTMGRQYVKALEALKVGSLHVCSRSEKRLAELKGRPRVASHATAYQDLKVAPNDNQLVILSLPVPDLPAGLRFFLQRGFKKILCEKPVSLFSSELAVLSELASSSGAEVWCAYNRVAYPSFIEARHLAAQEGGLTSFFFNFTELTETLHPEIYSEDDQLRWGASNSVHVMSMAFGLGGLPASLKPTQHGTLPWHPRASTFVGSGVSVNGVPFSYMADWRSKGRWAVEFHTEAAAYSMMPLEKLRRKSTALGAWNEVPVETAAPDIKAGVLEEIAAALNPALRASVPLYSLTDGVLVTRAAEQICGYTSSRERNG